MKRNNWIKNEIKIARRKKKSLFNFKKASEGVWEKDLYPFKIEIWQTTKVGMFYDMENEYYYNIYIEGKLDPSSELADCGPFGTVGEAKKAAIDHYKDVSNPNRKVVIEGEYYD